MKKILLALALVSGAAQAATLNPIQLLNPAGSSSGQTIVSTGASTAPAWAAVPATGLSGIVPVANGGTNRATLTAHGVIVGEGTASVGLIGPCNNGQMLLGVTGADPYCGNNPAISGGTVDGTPIGATTTSTGAFTTISASLAITPSQTFGIAGTNTNNNVNAGSIGEYVTNSATGVSLTTGPGNNANITSVLLTAGDWDVTGTITFAPNSTTTVTVLSSGISTTSVTMPAGNTGALTTNTLPFTTGAQQTQTVPATRISLAATTTVYLVGQAFFGTSTMTASGFIRARRVR